MSTICSIKTLINFSKLNKTNNRVMAYYFKINESKDIVPPYKGFHLQKVKELKAPGPNINYDFTKHVLVELLDDVTPESKLWKEMGLTDNKNIVHKRMMIDSHRIKCRRAIVVCVSPDEAKQLAQRLSQTKVMKRCICAVVIQDLLSDLSLFEKQIIKFGDSRSQHQFLYVSDLSRSRGPSGLTKFLKEKFSSFGTILSVLVCSDDNDYAYPEGVIKFAYLSEAFAAELAFDQIVVDKERLSVTTHHNILLSQCDLRVRLRDAQWSCNIENNDFSDSYFNHTYKLNSLSTINDSVESSMSNLHISHVNNSKISDYNSIYDDLEDTLPAFSQYNFQENSPKCDFEKTATKKNCDKGHNLSSSVSSAHKNSLNSINVNSAMNSHSNLISSSAQQIEIDTSKTAPFEMSATIIIQDKANKFASETASCDMSATKIIGRANKAQKSKLRSRKNIALDSLLSSGKSPRNQSDSGSFVTCDSLEPNSNALFLSPKKSSYKSFNSRRTDSILECESLSSNCKPLSSLLEENENDSEVIKESLPKHSKKRKKKYTPSQKLCLKSQRTGLSQGSVLNTSTQFSEPSSPQQQNSQKYMKAVPSDSSAITDPKKSFPSSKVSDWLSHLPLESIEDEALSSKKKIEIQDKKVESSDTSKVADWLLNIPTMSVESSEVADEFSDLPTSSDVEKLYSKKKIKACPKSVFIEKTKVCRSKISVHRTPAFKSNVVIRSDYVSNENEDPNRIPLISSLDQRDSIVLTDEYKSPLQMWLKQELVSSTNNSVFESKESSKSVIVCVTKTGNNFISVGCSHMTCDTCYPESTDLLLGYS